MKNIFNSRFKLIFQKFILIRFERINFWWDLKERKAYIFHSVKGVFAYLIQASFKLVWGYFFEFYITIIIRKDINSIKAEKKVFIWIYCFNISLKYVRRMSKFKNWSSSKQLLTDWHIRLLNTCYTFQFWCGSFFTVCQKKNDNQ